MTIVPPVARPRAFWAPTILSLALGACGTLGPQDGPPSRTLNPADIRDAVPQSEPPSKYGNPGSYVVAGKRYYVLQSAAGYVQQGTASWYGTKFHGRRTSSGEIYDMYAMSAAHTTLPLPSYVQVTNLQNRKSAIVKVNDRGPFHDDRLIDLSYAAAVKLGITASGTAPVEIRAIETPPQAEAQRFTVAGSPGRFVQVGAFTDRGNAERLQERISLHVPFPVTVTDADNRKRDDKYYYKVRIGPLSDRREVEATASRLSDLGLHEILILND